MTTDLPLLVQEEARAEKAAMKMCERQASFNMEHPNSKETVIVTAKPSREEGEMEESEKDEDEGEDDDEDSPAARRTREYHDIMRRVNHHMETAKAAVKYRTTLNRYSRQFYKKAYKVLCNGNDGFCLALGRAQMSTEKVFNMPYLTYLTGPIRKIGTDSQNGVVFAMPFVSDDLKLYAILKCEKERSKSRIPDSLFYEYLVGLYINSLTDRFPHFIRTLGIYQCKHKEFHHAISRATKQSNAHENDPKAWKRSLLPLYGSSLKVVKEIRENPGLLGQLTCHPDSYLLCLLVESVHDPMTMADFSKMIQTWQPSKVSTKDDPKYVIRHYLTFELPYVLYQIYYTLSALRESFTHYDLHRGNVLLYKVGPRSYITYNYHSHESGRTLTFQSQLLVKFIDYGRCFFEDHNGFSSEEVFQMLSQSEDCGDAQHMGQFGHRGMAESLTPSNLFRSKRLRNMSHDLRFLTAIMRQLNQDVTTKNGKYFSAFFNDLYSFVLGKVKYGLGFDEEVIRQNKEKAIRTGNVALEDITRYGTEEVVNPVGKGSIYNVRQAKEALEKFIIYSHTHSEFLVQPKISKSPKDFYQDEGYTQLCVIDIYDDGRPMKYKLTTQKPKAEARDQTSSLK